MKPIGYLAVLAALVISFTACSKGISTTSADSSKKAATETAKAVMQPRLDSKSTVAAGTKLRVALLDSVSSDKSQAGDQFVAALTEPVIVDGKTVLSEGTKVRGEVTDATESSRVKGRASLELKLTEIMCDAGNSVSIDTKPYTAVTQPAKKPGSALGPGTGSGPQAKRKEIRYAPEHLLSFTLASPVEI